MKTLFQNFAAFFKSANRTAFYAIGAICFAVAEFILSTESKEWFYAVMWLNLAFLFAPFVIKAKRWVKITSLVLAFAIGAGQFQEVRAQARNVTVGAICLIGGVVIAVVLARRCNRWFGPPPQGTNAPKAGLEGVWKDTNSMQTCYCDGMDAPYVTNSAPYQFSLSVSKSGNLSPISVGEEKGVVITVGEIGYTVDASEGKSNDLIPVLVEYRQRLERGDWMPFVIVLAEEGVPFTIRDPVTADGIGFYRTSIMQK